MPKGALTKRPEPFNGKRGKEAQDFLNKMNLYFNRYRIFSREPGRKIEAVLTNMAEGEASQWAHPYITKFANDTPHDHLNSWETFRDAFLKNFSDPLRKERAIRDIQKLTQNGSAQAYTTQFRNLAEELEWDENALIDRYKTGLKPEVRAELLRANASHYNRHMDLEEWIQLAIELDDICFQARKIKETPATGYSPRKEQGKTGETKKIIPEDKRVPPEEMKRRMKEGLCIKCGRKGHRIAACDSKEWVKEGTVKGKAAEIKEGDEGSESTGSEN